MTGDADLGPWAAVSRGLQAAADQLAAGSVGQQEELARRVAAMIEPLRVEASDVTLLGEKLGAFAAALDKQWITLAPALEEVGAQLAQHALKAQAEATLVDSLAIRDFLKVDIVRSEPEVAAPTAPAAQSAITQTALIWVVIAFMATGGFMLSTDSVSPGSAWTVFFGLVGVLALLEQNRDP